MTTLELNKISVRLAERSIIESFSASVKTGDILFITGDNGSGKSTLLKTIARYTTFSEGHIFLGAQESAVYSLSEWHSRVHYLPQHNTLAFPVKVRDLLIMSFYREKKWYEQYSADQHVKVEEMALRFRIAHLLDRNAKELSGGELQLCWLAQSFLAKPEVLLLDEPTQYLDATNRTAFFSFLYEEMQRNPFICLCVTHDLPFMKEPFGHVIEMQKL